MRGGYLLQESAEIRSYICRNCIRKQQGNALRGASSRLVGTRRDGGSRTQWRSMHGPSRRTHKSRFTNYRHSFFEDPPLSPRKKPEGPRVRERLVKWQEEHGNPLSDLLALDVMGSHKSPMPDNHRRPISNEADEDEPNVHNGIPETSTLHNTEELSVVKGRWYGPGDLVELWEPSFNGSPNLAIHVKTLNATQCQVITSRGKWMNSRPSFQYSLPKFLSPSVVKPVLPYLPSEAVMDEYIDQAMTFDLSVPRSVTGPIVTALNDFIQATEEVYRKHAARLDNAHQILSHPTDLRFGNLQKISAQLLGTSDLSPPAMYAVRRALLRAGIGFGVDLHSHSTTDMFQIRSQKQLQLTETVQGWLRDYQEAKVLQEAAQHSPVQTSHDLRSDGKRKVGVGIISGFIQKCIPAIAESRKKRPIAENGFIGISPERYAINSTKGAIRYKPRFDFTEAERTVVRFMEHWCLQNLFVHSESLQALAPLLLRETGMYKELLLNNHTGLLMLQELGVLDPFVNRALYDVDLLLPTSQHSKPLEQLATALSSLNLEDAKLEDSMASLRHDFKDLPVFCIDSQGAGEIDDGISVEHINDSTNEYWCHIHVANPTAFIKGNSVFAKMAAHLTESFYAPETVYKMLPSWLSDKLLSLRADRPTLTFSARINDLGVVKDFKIQSGIIRNVITLYYEDIAGLLGLAPSPPKKSYIIGTTTPLEKKRKPPPELTEDQLDMLRTVHRLSNARYALRESNGGLFFDAPWVDVSVRSKTGKYGLPPSYARRRTTASVHGDPVIELHAREARNWFSVGSDTTEHLVREMMVLACEVAGRFAASRNIPLIFRGMAQNPHAEYTPKQYQSEVLGPAIAEHGTTPFSMGLKMVELHGTAVLGAQPLHHSLMGLNHYCKVTSPLRRYGDMIAHWQIESALRHEAAHGDAPIQPADLAFSEAQITAMMGTLLPRERLITRAKKRALRHWTIQFMLRAYTFGEPVIATTTSYAHAASGAPFSTTTTAPAPLPRVIPVVFNSTTKHYDGARLAHGLTADMGVRVQFSIGFIGGNKAGRTFDAGFFDELRVGDCWECEVVHVNAYTYNFEVSPLRLLWREGEGEGGA